MKMEIEFKERPKTSLGGGFYENWIEAKSGKTVINLDSGAGCGNPTLTLSIKEGDGPRRWFDCDVRGIIQEFADRKDEL